MRTLITIFALILFMGSCEAFIWNLTHNPIDKHYMRIWFDCTVIMGILFSLIDEILGYVAWLQVQFNWILKAAIAANFIFKLINDNGYVENSLFLFLTFNGSVLALSLMINFSGLRHGAFKKTSYLNNGI